MITLPSYALPHRTQLLPPSGIRGEPIPISGDNSSLVMDYINTHTVVVLLKPSSAMGSVAKEAGHQATQEAPKIN